MDANAAPLRPARQRWIVLTPSQLDAPWRKELWSRGAAAGLQMLDGSLADGPHAAAPEAIFMTTEPSHALARPNAEIVVLAPDTEDLAALIARRSGAAMPTAVWQATLTLATLAAMAPEHRLIAAAALKASAGQPLALFPDLTVTPPAAAEAEAAAPPPEVDPAYLEAARRALSAFGEGRPAAGVPVRWDPPLFQYDARARRDVDEPDVLDTTGRHRILMWGPYFHLPPGEWRMTVRFELDAAAARRRLRIDWGEQTHYGSHEFVAGQDGFYELTLDHVHGVVGAYEFRILVMEASFDGLIRVQDVTITRIGDAPADWTPPPAASPAAG